jgi:hypothetical protein
MCGRKAAETPRVRKQDSEAGLAAHHYRFLSNQ